MVKSQEIKLSEARIMVFLEIAPGDRHRTILISAKLNMDYAYCARIMHRMRAKGWLRYDQPQKKRYLFITPTAPISAAKAVIVEAGKMDQLNKEIQQTLEVETDVIQTGLGHGDQQDSAVDSSAGASTGDQSARSGSVQGAEGNSQDQAADGSGSQEIQEGSERVGE